MVLFDKIRQNAGALKRIGEFALIEARKAGVPVHYMEPAYGNDIIREFPDGRRQRIVRENGSCVFVAIPPRT